jgi:hypothetical protein
MGQQVGGAAFSIIGTVAGSAIGGPVGGAIGGMAGGLIGSLIFGRAQKPMIPDWQLAGSSYGHVIPTIYGQVRLAGTFIWESDLQVKAGRGKGAALGGSGGASQYLQSAALGFCAGPNIKLLKLWADGNLLFDGTSSTPHLLVPKHQRGFVIRWYEGGEDQVADGLIAIWVQFNVLPPDACPAFRGMAYLVIERIDLTNFGMRFPNITALVASDAVETVIYVKLNRWETDVSTDTSLMFEFYGAGVAVDWVRGLVYQKSFDGTIRVFDIASGQCIMAKTWVQMWAQMGTVPVDRFGTTVLSMGWTTVQGSNLYLASNAYAYDPTEIWTVDPNTLNVIHTATVTPPVALSVLNRLIGVSVVNPYGAKDVLVGVNVLGHVMIIDPDSGASTGPFPMHYGGIDTNIEVIVGQADTINGTVEIWVLNSNILFGGGSATMYVYKTTVTANWYAPLLLSTVGLAGPGILTQMAILTSADFGVAPGGSLQDVGALYDAADDTLIISAQYLSRTIKWSPTAGVVWISAQATLDPNVTHDYFQTTSGLYGDGFVSPNFTVTDTGAGSVVTAIGDPTFGVNASFGYSSDSNAVIFQKAGTNDIYVAYLQRHASANVPVADIITDLCGRVGITPAMLDVSLVLDTTIGYAVTQSRSVASCLADLCQAYQLDMVESDYKLKFVPRGQTPVAALTQGQLGLLQPNDGASFWAEKHAQEQEMPLQINLRYTDPGFDFQPMAAYAKRTALPVPTQFARRVQTVDLPIVADSLQAAKIAQKWLYTMWAERDTYQTALGSQYLWLDPADVVTVTLDNGDAYSVRIESIDVGADYTMQLHLASEDNSVYAPSSTTRGADISFVPQTVSASPFVDLLLFNAPLLQDTDDLAGTASRIYYAGGPITAAATSTVATLYKSTDNTAWPVFDTLTGFAVWGHAQLPLGDTVAPFSTDMTNTLTVDFANGATLPTSCSYLELMNGANAMLVGQEIIQFQTIADNADGSCTLSTLLRARRGTEWATATHLPGEVVVLLVAGEIGANHLPLGELNNAEFWRLVPSGRFLDTVPTDVFTYKGYDLFPYAPVQLARAISGSDLVLTWLRRTRIGGLMMDGTDAVPLSEETEAYEAYVLPAGGRAAFNPTVPATYTRKFAPLTAPTVTYTAAMMSADAFAPATDTLYLAVYQISGVIGRGFQGYAALPAF